MIQNPVLKVLILTPVSVGAAMIIMWLYSSFEWFPGLPIYHSRDLKHWQLLTHVLTDDNNPDLKAALRQRHLGPEPDLV